MEEATSWKNHSFTLMIFGGIIVLCSIFFALGMVVGRTQGRHIAEVAYAERVEKDKTPDDSSEAFPLTFHNETKSDRPVPDLQPPPAAERAPAPRDPSPARQSKSTPPKASASAVPPPGPMLQVHATANEKQAKEEIKRLISKGFKGARILPGTANNAKLYRIVVGPYKESEIDLAKKDLRAKGYKDVFVAK